ncbi:MAG: chemotaxis protein CheW [Paracoccaceae bacterium]
MPLLDLGAELGYRDPLGNYSGGVVLLIGQEDGPAAAIAVDSIEDQRQVVIKGLQDSYGRVPGIAAATILGDEADRADPRPDRPRGHGQRPDPAPGPTKRSVDPT